MLLFLWFSRSEMGCRARLSSELRSHRQGPAARPIRPGLRGDMDRVEVIARRRPIPDWAAQGDYENDPEFRRRIQEWVSEIWAEKDALIESRL